MTARLSWSARLSWTARLSWSALLIVVAAIHLGAGWQGWLPSVVFALSALVAFACAPLLRWSKVPTGLALFGVLVLALTAGYWVARDTAESADPTAVLLDLVPRVLTAARPAPATPELLVPGALLTFAVAFAVAVSVAGRGRSLLAPVIGTALLYTGTALLTAGGADRNGLVAVGLVALIALGWLLVDRLEAGGRVLLGLPAVPVAVVALLAALLPATDAFEPRELVEPPVTDLGVASPLPQLASWANLGDVELFRLKGPERAVRLVALSDYSGAAWRAASLYGPLGAVAAPDLPPGKRVEEAEIEVTIGELGGSWVPTVGRPTSVTLDRAVVDPNSGSLVLPDALTPGLTYRSRGVVDVPDDNDLLAATVPTDGRSRRYLALPGLPYSLAEYARQIARNARTPYERAVAIEQVVKTGRTPDAQAPVGSSYARLERFLFGNPGEPGANAGTAEQFASAFAVLGRAVGLPTRVVVGFQPASGEERVVRAADATAWPEVYFDGWGWVPFDPVTGTSSGGSSAAAKREVLDRLASITATPTTALSAPPPFVPPTDVPQAQATAQSSRQWVGLLALAAIPLLVVLLLGALRAGRRVRLRRAGAAGAWDHVLDLLLLSGRAPRRDRTAPDIARDLALAPAIRLADLADRSAFAPERGGVFRRPPPGSTATLDQADEAWHLAREVRAGLRKVVPWHRRLFWPIDPRPLWRR
ncbi:transglutaminaseTgpA domain-containing protein [Actinosynnema sp. NPDC047251]|uniref:Putative membrane protein n=1 Tax=Saccharothrix espanaensis (strain ATCC 51144 / DSM 44229 / JCM 9112 / NBRC 15066 / NRRL 15764) TaxID=1179773 RepID=K0JSD1_SACES|nr:transglutaminase domain-containing protein [Saccharothrix espanaensis]CCH30575.1 putative membrane protein [Saccharothrix espanaensis DSM 44229]